VPNPIPGTTQFSCLLRETNPYKASRDAPRRVFAPRSRKHALAAINKIFPKPVPFPISARTPYSFLGRVRPLGELATSSSVSPWSRFSIWRTEGRNSTSPASFQAAAMAPPCWGSAAGRRWPPGWNLHRWIQDRRSRKEDTPSG
jgi:hypothetical protein